ncbi:MAG: EamA family transporter [Acidiferrobacterales bacterium]
MHLAIAFALLSLLFAGINDVVFKRYSRKERSRGMYVFGIGVVWTVLQVITFRAQGIPFAFDQNTLLFGLTAGVFLTISNILLIESLTHIEVSLGSTIYRLNTIGVVILSVFFLSEPLGLLKSLGIVAGIIGVLLLYQKQSDSHHNTVFVVFFAVAIAASLSRAAYGVSAKAGILQNADPNTMLLLFSSSWIVGGACYAKLREKRFRLTRKKVLYSLLSGILVFLIVNFLMLAIEYGEASIVIPVANLSFVVALFLSTALKMEALTVRKLCAVGCAAASIALLSQA